jgi:hypothetical protein
MPFNHDAMQEADVSKEAVAILIDRWTNEPGFKDAFRIDPHGTIAASGITLSPEEEEALNQMDWTSSDEELARRVGKSRALG